MDDGLDDNGQIINFDIKSAAWNPYKGQGIECELGYLDLYIDTSLDSEFVVEFYKNNSNYPYKTQTVNSLPDLREHGTVQSVVPLNPSTDGYQCNASRHGLVEDQSIYIYQIEGPSFLNSQQYLVTYVDENTFNIVQDFSGNGTAITAISLAATGVVTAPGHPFFDGKEIIISGGDMTEVISNIYIVANATVDTFELRGINTSGYTPYTSGGVVFPSYTGGGIVAELPFYSGKVWKRAYAGGVGYWHQVRVFQQESNSPFRLHAMMPWFKQTGGRMI